MARGIKIDIDLKEQVVQVNQTKIAFDELGNSLGDIKKAIMDMNDTTAGSVKFYTRMKQAITEISQSLDNSNKNYRNHARIIQSIDKEIAKLTDTRSREQIAIDGSVAQMRKEVARLKEIQSNLSTTNKEYLKHQKRIDSIEKSIARITDTRRKEAKVYKGSANYIREQIRLLEEEQQNRKRVNGTYRELEKRIQKLKKELDDLTDTQEDYEKVQEGSIAYHEEKIRLLEMEQRNRATDSDEVERYQKLIEEEKKKIDALVNSTEELSKAKQSYSSSAGAAGHTATEFGRILADMPYGIQGVANNVEQFTQAFVDLQRKNDGVVGALKSLGSTIMGPAGIVVAVQAISAGLQFYMRAQEKAEKATKSTAEAAAEAGVDLKIMTELLKGNNLTEQERIDLVAQANEEYEDLNIVLDENGRLTKQGKEDLDQYIKSLENAAKARAIQALVEEEYKKQASGFVEEAALSIRALGTYLVTLGNAQKAAAVGVEEQKKLMEESSKTVEEYIKQIAELTSGSSLFGDKTEEEGNADDMQDMLEDFTRRTRELKTTSDLELLEIQKEYDKKEAEQFENNGELLLAIDAYYEAEKTKILEEQAKEREKLRKEEAKKANEIARQQALDNIDSMIAAQALDRERKLVESEDLMAYLESERNIVKSHIDNVAYMNTLSAEEQARLKLDLAVLEKEIDTERINQEMAVMEAKLAINDAVSNSLGSLSQLFGEHTAAGKSFALAQIALDVATGYTRGLAIAQESAKGTGPAAALAFPVFYAQQVAAVLAAAANAKKVLSATKELKGAGSVASAASTAPSAAPSFNVVGASQINQLAQTISATEDKPIRTYVVASDVSTAQELDRKIVEGAAI